MCDLTEKQHRDFLLQLAIMGITEEESKLFAYPVVGENGNVIAALKIDGWNHLAVKSGKFDGCKFTYGELTTINWGEGNSTRAPEWVECAVYLKDTAHPVEVREYLYDNYREVVDGCGVIVVTPWQTHTARCLRHKAQEQAYKTAFGICGKAEDEAQAIANALPSAKVMAEEVQPQPKPKATAKSSHSVGRLSAKQKKELAIAAKQFADMAKKTGGWQAAKSVIGERYSQSEATFLLEALAAAQAEAEPAKE